VSVKVRHLSLDVWDTLIAPNPEFSEARDRYLSKALAMPVEAVRQAYRAVKDESDRAAEVAGAGASSEVIYNRFAEAIGRPDLNWWPIRQGLERLLAKYPPKVLPETIEALRHAQGRGLGLSIASNTNFLRGEALNDVVLGTWGVAWDFQTFSDQISRAKPHPRFWKVVTERAWALTGAKPQEILHIGDHKVCDAGCRNHGLQFKHVRNLHDTVSAIEGALA
jgi:FMN phosphatase YigB (HAD superfamily)